MEALREAATLFRAGAHQQATKLLEQVQCMPSPGIVEVGTAILKEPLSQDTSYVQFYAARVLRCAVIRDWTLHWCRQPEDILTFAVTYLSQNIQLLHQPAFKGLLSELCTIWSVTWKLRCGASGGCDETALGFLVGELEAFAVAAGPQGTEENKIVLRALLVNCIEEFGLYHADSHSRVLPIATHEACRRAFKHKALYGIMSLCFSWGYSIATESARSAHSLVSLWYSLLCWNFSNTVISVSASMADRIPEVLCCEGSEWYGLFGGGVPNPSAPNGTSLPLVMLLVNWYHACATGESTGRAYQEVILQCMLQLSGVTATDWPEEGRLKFFEDMSHSLFTVSQSLLSGGDELYLASLNVTCAAIHRLVSSIDCSSTVFVHPRATELFFTPLLQLTQALVTLTHDGVHGDDEALTEASESLLRTWLVMVTRAFGDVTVLASIDGTPVKEALSQGAATILRLFVHLKSHDASASSSSAVDGGDETVHSKEYGESQMQVLALLGRDEPAATAMFLGSTLKQLSDEYLAKLTRNEVCPEKLLDALWFVLGVTAHFFADGSLSERNMIPNSIINLALHWEREYPEDEARQEMCNEVFTLMRSIIALTANLLPAISNGLVSPAVAHALLQVYRHYVGAYVFPDEMLQLDFCNAVSTAFSGGVVVADSALQLTGVCLTSFPFESDVTMECGRLLSAFSEKPPQLGEWLVTQAQYGNFVRFVSDPTNPLSGKSKGNVLGFLVGVTPLTQVVTLAVEPASHALQVVLQRAATTPRGQLLDVDKVINAVDALSGAFTALRSDDQTKTVFCGFATLVDMCATIVQIHTHSKPLLTSILRMMNTIVESCSFLASSSFIHVVELGLTCIAVTRDAMEASRANAIGLSKDAANQEEDERIDVLSAAAKFVESVATWGLLDLNGDDDPMSSSRSDAIAELSVQGLLIVLNFCDASVLSIPQLRDTTFNLLQEVSTTFTGRFLNVSADQATCLLSATEFALQSSVPSLNCSGYKVMESIAQYCLLHNLRQPILQQFLRSVVSTMASGSCDSSTYHSIANALFALAGACGEPTTSQTIYEILSQNPLLASAFHAFVGVLESTSLHSKSREVKNKFARDIESVLLTIRGTRIV